MANGSNKDRAPNASARPRNASIPTAESDGPDDLLTDPGIEFEDGLQSIPPQITDVPTYPHAPGEYEGENFDDPTVAAGNLASLNPSAVAVADADSFHDAGYDEATAAISLPARVPDPASTVAPPSLALGAAPRAFNSDVGTAADRGRVATVGIRPDAARPGNPDEAKTAPPRPSSEPGAPSLAGFVDPSLAPAPAQIIFGHEGSEPQSLPGSPVQEAPPFVVDEQTFGPNEPMTAGTQVAFGSYRADELIGEGRLTRVYRATDLRTDTTVALKEFRDPGEAMGMAPLRNLLERFREGQTAPGVLSHEGSIALLDFVDDTNRGPLVVMEYVPAGDLESFLAHRGRPLSPREAAKLFLRVCDVLTHALDHGVVHGDVQPRNILLTEDARPKIDLITPVLSGHPVARPDAHFASPEVQAGQAAGPAADVYGLGASLYQACTDPRVAAEGGEAPGLIEPIIARCVEDDPQHRYATVRELGGALTDALDNRGPKPTASPSPWVRVGIAIAAVAVGLAIGWAVIGMNSEPAVANPMVTISNITTELMSDAARLQKNGQTLEAAAAYKRLMDANPSLTNAATAHASVVASDDFKKGLRELRRRLRKASPDDQAQVRKDLALLGVLAPGDALIDHWRSRLNQSNDNGGAGSPTK